MQVAAADPDVAPAAPGTPVGLCLPTEEERFVSGVTSQGTSDCLVDRLMQWWEAVRERFPPLTTLGLTLENGPENHSRRTPCMQRMVDVVRQYPLHVRLAYSPPRPIARTIQSSAAGASWRTMGTGRCSTRERRSSGLPVP